jgi:hypothetical protein
LINDALRYPRRNGTTTTYLSEAEVAEAYRARFTGLAARVEEAERVEADFLQRLNTGEETFVVLTLVPDLPGAFTVDTQALQAFHREIIGRGPFIVDRGMNWQRASVRRRRLCADANLNNTALGSRLACELHESGTGSLASQLDRRDNHATDGTMISDVEDEVTVNAVAGALQFLARHARDRAAAGGYATVRATILPVTAVQPARLFNNRGFRGESMGRPHITAPPVADGVFDVDALAEPGPGLLAATYALCTGLFQEFGMPEALQITATGMIRVRYWQSGWQTGVRTWAAASGVEVTEDVLR